jgi:hypothetical protein
VSGKIPVIFFIQGHIARKRQYLPFKAAKGLHHAGQRVLVLGQYAAPIVW